MELRVADLYLTQYERCIHPIETYPGMGLGLVDASVITIAESRAITTLATLNQRDFRVVRPRHCAAELGCSPDADADEKAHPWSCAGRAWLRFGWAAGTMTAPAGT